VNITSQLALKQKEGTIVVSNTEIINSIKLNKYQKDMEVSAPKAGQTYIVIRSLFGDHTTTDTATFMYCTFSNGEKYKGFAKFNGSQQERDQMEISGLANSYFELLDDVLYFAPLKLTPTKFLDYNLEITDEKHVVMKKETSLAKVIISSFLEHHGVFASQLSSESEKREFGEDHDSELADLWDKAFDSVMAACFGEKQEGYGMSCPS
jgi:hypothetical protein